MTLATVDLSQCKRDALCVTACPMGVLETDANKHPRVAPGRDALCIHCGHCVATCPHGALTLDGIAPQDCTPLRQDLRIATEQVAQYFRSRRSIRCYQSRKIPRDVLENLLDLARWAPTAKNAQVVEWVAFDSPDQLRRLISLSIDYFRPNPALARLVNAWDAGQDRILRHAPLLLIAHAPAASYNPLVDCTIAMAHVDLLAGAFGLGGCWAGLMMAAIKGSPAVHDLLQLPIGHDAYGAMMLGYPKLSYARIPPRRELRLRWQ